MNCEDCRMGLMAFQLGEAAGEERDALEQHLCGCAACVAEFLELKRAVELAEEGPAPSPSLRVKVRASVEQEFGPRPAWWERPFAFAVGAASVAGALALVIH